MGKIIGIDLGTTNSVVAIMEGGKPIVIPNAEGERVTPSVIALDPTTGKLIVGTPAKRQAVTNPQSTVFSIKRFIGCKFGDPAIQQDVRLAPFKVCETNDGGISVPMGETEYSPTGLLAILLRKLKRDMEAHVGESVTLAVITVPAYFNDSQRQAVKDAGRIAELDVLRIINEPTAASLAYGLHKRDDRIIAVYHLGGGTLDISILDIGQGVFEVKATNGDTHLGGDDFDQRIIDWLCDEFRKEQAIDLRQNRAALQRLKWAAEKAKCELSVASQAEIDLPYITAKDGTHRHLLMTLTRARLEELVGELIERTLAPCKRALEDARLTTADVDEVVLVGQQTRMPAVRAAVEKFFGRVPCRGVDPAEVVALGAAVQGGVLGGEIGDIMLLDVTPLTLSIETLGGVATALIERNTTIPYRKSQIFSTTSDMQTRVEIHVTQGERPMSADNKTLGSFILDGIPPALRGVPQIEVTFDIDANGILNVQARDTATGQERRVTIIPPVAVISRSELTDVQARSDAGAMINKVEESLSEQGDRLTPHVRSIVDCKVSALHLALQGGNIVQVSRRTQELSIVLQCIEALGESNSARAVESLIKLLVEEDDKQVRGYIRRALRQIGDARVDEVLRPRTWQEKLLGRRLWVDQ